MYRLRLLGGLSLEEAGGVHTGKAAQRRRLALLALLEMAPRRTLTRDKVIALLWADEGAEQSRHRLAVLIHELRKVLGDDSIRSAGDDVSLNHELVASDVADFNAALAAGEYERAVSLYDGPFLDGVFLSDAPEFEHWADAEREKLERSYRNALEEAAGQHEAAGRWRNAAELWQKATASDRLNSRVAMRYMDALARAGETASALQFARVHEVLLQEELGVEVTPEYRAFVGQLPHTKPPTREDPPQPPAAMPVVETTDLLPPLKQRRRIVAGVVFAFLLIVLVAFVVRQIDGDMEAAADPDEPVVVGVLPFVNVSDNRSNEHIAIGMTEELISALGKLDGLIVPSSTTVAAYKARNVDAQTVAGELGAAYLMEGSVRRIADELRITVRLLNAAGNQVWSDSYNRPTTHILDVQSEIASAAVDELQSRLEKQLARPKMEYTTRDPQAYELYLRGRAEWLSRSPGSLEAALRYFRQAIAHDSTYARAYAGIADVYNMLGAYNYGMMRPGEAYPQARAAAAQALRLDPELAEAHAALGNYLYNYERKWPEAIAELQRGLRLNPGYSMGKHWLELVMLISGKEKEALEVIRSAREQDPRSPLISSALAHHYYYRRNFDDAIREYHHAIELDSTFLVARLGLAMTYSAVGKHEEAIEQANAAVDIVGEDVPVVRSVRAFTLARAGKTAEARAMLAQLERDRHTRYIAPHFLALVHAGLGEDERALTALEEAFNERSGAMLYLRLEPPLERLYEQPRFRALVQRVHR